MNRFKLIAPVTILTIFCVATASAESWSATDPLDTLLPTPSWLRSRADELNVDAQTKERIEKKYKAAEPQYHEAKRKVEQLTKQLHETLVADELNEETILKRMRALLRAENELKLYQVRVRISLWSQLSAKQRRMARELARRKPEPNFRKALESKVERIRQLSKLLKDSGGSVTELQKRMKNIEKTIAAGKIVQGARGLDQVIRKLEKALDKHGKEQQPE